CESATRRQSQSRPQRPRENRRADLQVDLAKQRYRARAIHLPCVEIGPSATSHRPSSRGPRSLGELVCLIYPNWTLSTVQSAGYRESVIEDHHFSGTSIGGRR